MPRIVYVSFPKGTVAGGQKMILRHVEALRDLGFDAIHWRGASNIDPAWFDHRAPGEVATALRPDDIVVIPEDSPGSIKVPRENRTVVFSQNQFSFARLAIPALDTVAPERFPTFIVPGPTCGDSIRRAYPQAVVELVPCFADERIFRWRGAKRPMVAYAPRKRPVEADIVRTLFRKYHPGHARIPWRALAGASETQVAETFSSATLFLSLSRMESVGMTPLEAMASGCMVAGFTGIGGRDFATPENGFWVDEDDVEACADAMAQAADVAAAGGLAAARRLEAGHETAARWSYANFRVALEEVWMRLAPDARIKDGPLD